MDDFKPIVRPAVRLKKETPRLCMHAALMKMQMNKASTQSLPYPLSRLTS